MSRRNSGAAEQAAAAASEAARVLQQRGQEAKAEAKAEPAKFEPPALEGEFLSDSRIEELKKNSPRNQMMEEIVTSRPDHKEPPKEPEAVESPKETPKAAEAEPQVVEQAPPEAPKTVRVKVDGEEFDAPAEEVEAAGGVGPYRIQRAAENRLKKANEALADARRAQSEMTQLATAMLAKQAPAKPQETDEAFIASKMETIRFGTPEEAARAQIEITQRLYKPVDQNAMVEQATSKWSHDLAVRAFDKEFSDVSMNPIRLRAVVALRNERLDRHRIDHPNQPIDWDSFYRTIGNEVRSAFGGSSQAAPSPAATSGNPSPASDKEARKASIVNLPAAAAKAEAPREDKPETRDDILNSMRKKRGIPVG